jgi:uncharacterized membrane protein YhhN
MEIFEAFGAMLLCILTILVTYTIIGVVVYCVLLGQTFWTALELTLKEFKFWSKE